MVSWDIVSPHFFDILKTKIVAKLIKMEILIISPKNWGYYGIISATAKPSCQHD